jgi:UDP-N-acetylmuramoylalanine--D-glutamate ligase
MPLIRACDEATADDLIIAEISSFQLEWIKDFRPKVSVITNITVDHSDRQTWDEYVAAKWRIAENQGEGDTMVLRSDVAKLPPRPGNGEPESPHYWGFRGATIYFDQLPRPSWINQLLIPGEHNSENVMAAIAAARAFGIDDETIQKACLAFKGVVHRLEFVLTDKNGVTWINNSMCTNNDAFARSLDAITTPKIVLCGGVYKGGATDQFGKAASLESVKNLLCYGKSGSDLADVAKSYGQKSVAVVDKLIDAVEMAKSLAQSGDTIILSPACASFDQFKDFEDRGDQFKAMVRKIAE